MGLKEDATKKAIDVAGDNAPSVLGMLFPYAGLKRKAVDVYVADIEKSDLSREIKAYLIANAERDIKRIINQKSIADIAINNASIGTDFSDKSRVNEEWLERFMDSAAYVSDESVQIIWGKILAGEFEQPGSTPPNMTRILSELTPNLAIAFNKICSMRVFLCQLTEDELIKNGFYKLIVPYHGNMDSFLEMGISFKTLNELETIGLIKVDTIGGYVTNSEKLSSALISDGKRVGIVRNIKNDQLPIGNVLLTLAGDALSKILDDEVSPELGYYEMLENYYENHHYELSGEHSFVIEEHDGSMNITKID